MPKIPVPQGIMNVKSFDKDGKAHRVKIHVPLTKYDVNKLIHYYYPADNKLKFAQRLKEILTVEDYLKYKYATGWIVRYLLIHQNDVVDPNMVKKINQLLDGSIITVYRLSLELALSKDSLYRYSAHKRGVTSMQISVGMALSRYYDLVFNEGTKSSGML